MFRQVQTAMHSIMVGNLAMELLESVIRNRPDLLVGQLHTENAKDVKKRRKKLLSYLYCGALLHDIGKLLCSSVINAQSHLLGELEFRVLKFHPVTGAEMLQNLPELSIFRDIVIGHQRSCDGASGYPMEFDNTSSPQKIFIDIITICDSLDAATDQLGRNYAAAKNFSTVLEELRAGSKTRYSEALVNLMLGDTELQKRLRHLLEEGRRDVYYEVHKMILSELRIHTDRKNTHHWMFDMGIMAPDH